jgi:hypothetical protein
VPKADGVPAGLFWKNDIKGHQIAHEQNETEKRALFHGQLTKTSKLEIYFL